MVSLNLKKAAVVWLVVLGMWCSAGGAWAAQGDSVYGVYVQDEANVISLPTKNELYSRAIWLHDKTGTAQVGIVTVDSLNNQTIEDYAVTRFRKMGLGDKERNDGVLLLYSAADRHVRIEVGYGLEGRIPDGKAGAILDQYFVPNRDAGRMDLAFSQTQSALINEVAAEYGLDTSGITDGGITSPPVQDTTGFFNNMPGYVKILLGIGVVFLIFLDFKFTGGAVTFAIMNLIGRRGSGGGGRGGGRGGGGSSGGGGASR
jgi:uncharacterized protein